MKNIIPIVALLLLVGCAKSDLNESTSGISTSNGLRSNPVQDSIPVRVPPSQNQLNTLDEHIMSHWDSTTMAFAMDSLGTLDWSQGNLLRGTEYDEDYVMTIPFIDGDIVSGVILMEKNSGNLTFDFVNLDWLAYENTSDLATDVG